MMRAIAAVVSALVLAIATLVSGAEAQQAPATFSAKTTLLTVDVTALDKDGKSVPGLTAEDFEVKINGKVQPVQALAYVEAPRAAVVAAEPVEPVMAGVTSRRTVANPVPRGESRVFVVIVDDMSFTAGDGKALFVSAETFVSRLPASDYVGYSTTSGASVINPTRDRRLVLAALKHAVGTSDVSGMLYRDAPIISMSDALLIDGGDQTLARDVMLRECFDRTMADRLTSQTPEQLERMSPCASGVPTRAGHLAALVKSARDRQIQALASTVASLRGVPGIKHVVLLSNGIAVTKEVVELVPIARAAAAAGVEISTMVQEGDIDLSDTGTSEELPGGGSTQVSTSQAQRRRDDSKLLQLGAQTMTDMAGGQFYRVIGQPRRFFDRVEASAAAVYRLGVGLPSGINPGAELSVTAKAKRAGVSVLTSHHAAAPVPEGALSADDRLKNAVAHGETHYDVAMNVGAIVRRGSSAGMLEIGVSATVPGGVAGPLNATFGLADPAGALKTGKRAIPASGGGDYHINFSMPVAAGTYSLRLAVADASGRIGSVTLPVQASLTPLGPLDASDVLTWVADSAGRMELVAVEDIPPAASALTAMVESNPRESAPANVAVKFAVLGADGRSILEKDATVTPGGGMLRADAPLDVSGLAAGRYGLRAAVSIGGAPAGTLTTTFRKR